MKVFAGDEAMWKPRGCREPMRVLVQRLTAKRAQIVVRLCSGYEVRYVKPSKLEKVAGGGAC